MRGDRARTGITALCIVNPFGYELFERSGKPSKTSGGAEVQLYYLATALAKDPDFTVSMIVEEPPGRVAPVSEGVRMIAVRPICSGFARLRDRVPVPAPAYIAAMRRANADVYLQRGGAVLTGDVAAYCKLTGRKFVFMAAHDWDCDFSHRKGAQSLSGAYYVTGLRAADLVFAQSALQRNLLGEHHGVSSLIQRTVYPRAEDRETPREHVLWVGRCLDWKRPQAFLDLAETMSDIPFLMVAPRHVGAPEVYERVLRRAAGIPNVEFRDFVPFFETEGLFRRAIAFVNTSVAEGFPNTFVQAARTATPVCSLEVNPDRIIEEFDIGYCAGGDLSLLGQQLARLVANAEKWRECSRNVSAYFRRAHDIDTQLPVFTTAVNRLVDRLRGR